MWARPLAALSEPLLHRPVDADDGQRRHQFRHDRAFPGVEEEPVEAVGADAFLARQAGAVVDHQFGEFQARPASHSVSRCRAWSTLAGAPSLPRARKAGAP